MPGQWDFFLAHAGADIRAAEELFGHLAGRSRVFLDARCLLLGDDWDRELPRAQRNALVTVVLISQGSEHAYYEREEIAQAIDMARRDPAGHRVVPVFLDRSSASRDEITYGLRLKHGVSVEEAGGLAAVAQKLLALLDRLRRPAAAQATPEQMPADGVGTTTAGFAGPTERGPTRPWLITSWAEYQDVFGDGLPSSVSFGQRARDLPRRLGPGRTALHRTPLDHHRDSDFRRPGEMTAGCVAARGLRKRRLRAETGCQRWSTEPLALSSSEQRDPEHFERFGALRCSSEPKQRWKE